VLWWRHHTQEEAARKTEKRQEAHEDDRTGRSAAGSVYGPSQPGRRELIQRFTSCA